MAFLNCYFLIIFHTTLGLKGEEKKEICTNLTCDDDDDNSVCGIRTEGEGFRLKLFRNECDLLKYGCKVDEEYAYGLINMEYCQASEEKSNHTIFNNRAKKVVRNFPNGYSNIYCDMECNTLDTKELCAIRKENGGYQLRLFKDKCELIKYNCENDVNYNETDYYICNEFYKQNDEIEFFKDEYDAKLNILKDTVKAKKDVKNIIVVNTKMFENNNDINDTIEDFFAASHVFDLPLKEINLNTRRRWIKNAGPVKVFVPWIVIPKNKTDDKYHVPTLSSCYHKCPTKCPDTYAPVCGVPGIVAREPSLMFQNHCFMDVAQCKMFWEQKSSTAHSSSYVESSFLFCMGDEMNAVYRFLPAIRTLQRMGRLKKKGKFRAKLKNFRFINHFRSGHPKFMG